ncbi:MAG: DUF3168 domain-containing protein [Pirellulales bacterium]|nr:DUF3168 domain-containing protein [Pirellulales bacterium]
MNLMQTIHQRWAADETLDGLLPASRVSTGINVDPASPYAVIGTRGNRPIGYHNDGSVLVTVGVRIQVFDEAYDAAAAIVAQVKATFDRTDFDLSGDDRVVNMQRTDDRARQEDDGTWQWVVDFDCTVYLGLVKE